MKINSRQDVSYLFSGMNKASSMNTSWMTDYAGIKNGSYGKLLKAYYSETPKDEIKSLAKNTHDKTVSTQEKKTLTKVMSATDSLKDSADKLLATGNKSVFGKEDTNKEAVYSAVSDFVKNYNSTMNAASESGTSSVVNRAGSMANNTTVNSKMLSAVGITINSDRTLSLNKDTFMEADMNKVKGLFQGNGSYGYQTSAQASLLNYAADTAASKTNTYTGNGTYSNYDSGALFDRLF